MQAPQDLQQQSALTLLMLGIFADNHYPAFSLDNLALVAHRLDRRSYFHFIILLTIALLRSPRDPALGKVIR